MAIVLYKDSIACLCLCAYEKQNKLCNDKINGHKGNENKPLVYLSIYYVSNPFYSMTSCNNTDYYYSEKLS